MPQFFQDFDVISKTQKKVFGLPHTDFLGSFRWALCCAHVLIEWFGNTPGANKGDWLQRNALGTRISNSAS